MVAGLKVVQGKHGTTRSLHPRNDVISSLPELYYSRQRAGDGKLIKRTEKTLPAEGSLQVALGEIEHDVLAINDGH